MPYDAAGNFTRAFNWTADKLAGIKIESERMDGEFDNFAAGMNQVLLRNGSIPWGGDLKLGGNKITGLGNGTEASPAIQFLSDTTTGIYLQSAGNLGLVASGVERLRINATGARTAGTHTSNAFDIDNVAGTNRSITGKTSGLGRWTMLLGDASAEGGGGAGSNFNIHRHNDAGVSLGVALNIERATGGVNAPVRFQSPSIKPGTSLFYELNGDTVASNLLFDNRGPPEQAYLQFNFAQKLLTYVSNGFVQMTFKADGTFQSRGSYATTGGVTAAAISIDGPNAVNRVVTSHTSGVPRWLFGADASVESGGNSGSGFIIGRFTDGGVWNGAAMTILRANNAVNFIGTVTTPGLFAGPVFLLSGDTNTSTIQFDNRAGAQQAYFQYQLAAQNLLFVSNSATQMTLGPSGNLGVRGNISTPNILAQIVTPGSSGLFQLYGDSTVSNIVLNATAGTPFAYMQYVIATQTLGYVANNAQLFTVSKDGRFTASTMTASASIKIGAGKFALDSNADASNIVFNSDGGAEFAYMQYQYAAKRFIFSFNGLVMLDFNALGDMIVQRSIMANTMVVRGGAINWNAATPDAIRIQTGLQGADGVGNTGNDWVVTRFDNAGAFLGVPLKVQRSDGALILGTTSTIQSPVSSGNGYVAPYAMNLIGSQPSISFNESNLGTKAVLGAVAGGGTPKFHMSRGNNTGLPFEFNIATGVGLAAAWTPTSDVRLKSNIQPLVSGLDVFAALNPVTYKQATNEDDAAAGIGFFSAGIIAQDLIGTPFEGLVVLPEDNGHGGMSPYAFNYTALTAWYIAAFKETRTRLNTERTRLTNARNRINVLESQLADVLARLDAAGI